MRAWLMPFICLITAGLGARCASPRSDTASHAQCTTELRDPDEQAPPVSESIPDAQGSFGPLPLAEQTELPRPGTFDGCILWLPDHEDQATGSVVTCTFLLDPVLSRTDLRVVQAIPGFEDRLGRIVDERRYSFTGPSRGIGTLFVLLENTRFEIARVEGVDFSSDGVTNDGRLRDIDLRGRVHKLDARLLDANLEPIGFRIVRAQDRAGHGTIVCTDEDGWFSLIVPREVESLDAKVEGYRKASFHDLEHVVLQPE